MIDMSKYENMTRKEYYENRREAHKHDGLYRKGETMIKTNLKLNKTSEILPKEGEYVLCFFGDRPWEDEDDKENKRFWKVVRLEKGISMLERKTLSESNDLEDIKRSGTYCSEDEFGNNQKPYYWDSFGMNSYFGQEAEYWCELPNMKL